jgi:hypothetical protein
MHVVCSNVGWARGTRNGELGNWGIGEYRLESRTKDTGTTTNHWKRTTPRRNTKIPQTNTCDMFRCVHKQHTCIKHFVVVPGFTIAIGTIAVTVLYLQSWVAHRSATIVAATNDHSWVFVLGFGQIHGGLVDLVQMMLELIWQ